MKWVHLCSSLNIIWHYPSLGLAWKLAFSSALTTAELWKFVHSIIFYGLKCLIQDSSSPLALFRVMLPKPCLTSTPGCLALGEWSHHHGYLGHWDIFLYSSSVYSFHLFLISSASVWSTLFLLFIEPIFAWNVPFVSLIVLFIFLSRNKPSFCTCISKHFWCFMLTQIWVFIGGKTPEIWDLRARRY